MLVYPCGCTEARFSFHWENDFSFVVCSDIILSFIDFTAVQNLPP